MFLTLKTLLAGTLLAAALPAQTPQTDRTAECAAAGETCYGVLRVPLDWADPASERIDVRYLWLPRGDRTKPALTTVVANGGGPGPLDPAYAELGKALLGPLADRVDVLMVEPRGFGDADPTCEGLDGDRPETITACARKLGEKAGYYTTDQAAADVDAARAAVGAQNVTFVGNSYGTLLGQAYAARFPRHLRAMFLTSVVGTGDDGYDQQGFRNQAKLGLANLEAACRRSPACARENRDPAALWERLVRRLRAHPDPRVPLRRTGPLVTAAHDARTTLAAANAYLRHDPAPLRRLITRKAPVELTPALFTYYCGDARFPFDRDAAPAERLRQLDAYAEQHRVFWPYTAAETESPAADWTRRCASWPTPRQSPPVSGTFPDVPVLAIGGQFDSDTAPDDAASVAARFPQGRSYTVPFGGHGQLFGFSPVSACL
ncbi:MAG: alpha/beta fold hydrolase, partial [Nonomuraea sp.]|nr:alpha/beta fold hydrolase [Nonomuraea sp.]